MTTATIPQWFSFVCRDGKSHGHEPTKGLPKYYNEDYKPLLTGMDDKRIAEILPGKSYTPEQIDALKKEFDDVKPTCGPHTIIDSVEHSGGRVCRRCSEYLLNSAAVGKHWVKCKPGPKDEDQSQIAE